MTDPAIIFAWVGTRFDRPLAALLALDAALGDVVRTTTEPLLGQMRLTWWHDALAALDRHPAPAQPLLEDLHRHVVPAVTGTRLARMADGWEVLLDPAMPTHEELRAYGAARGATLFDALATLRGVATDDAVRLAGASWALTDLAINVTDPSLRNRAIGLAKVASDEAFAARWPAERRAIGALAIDARCAAAGIGDAGSPHRAMAVLRFRLLGR